MIDMHAMNILIVDDMESMCKAVRGMLKVLDIEGQVFYAYNGRDAWEILQGEAQIDLAIIDWNMPIMTGVELLGRIRESRRLRDMPVVMVTAEANREIVAEAAESDIDAYLLKPITVKSLEDRIRVVIDKANNPPPMLAHLRQARDLEEKGDLEGALAEAILAMNANPASSRPLRELGTLYLRKDNLEEAERYFLQASQMNDMDVFALHALGDVHLKRGDMDKAGQYYEKAMQISPRHPERVLNLGKILLEKKMQAKAIKVFEKILDLGEDTLNLREEIADICRDKGEYAFAIQLYNVIHQHAPGRQDILVKLVETYGHAGDPKKSMPYLLELEKQASKDPKILMKIAKLYLAMRQNARADQALQKVMKLDPGNREAQDLIRQCL